MTDSNINDLDPVLQPIALKCLSDWAKKYPDRKPVRIIVTWRSNADQQKAYDSGLSKCKAGEGKHNCVTSKGKPASRAFDFGCFDEDGSYITDGTDSYYSDFGAIAVDNGLEWGGNWHYFKDFDHAELPD